MKALVFWGAHNLVWEERPEPTAGPGEVIVETRAVGVCGSDLHAYTGENRRRTPGHPMGHEGAGQVVALGPDVPASWLGKRVAMFPITPCGHCDQCQGGNVHRCRNRRMMGFNSTGAVVERLPLRVDNLFPLADSLSYVHGALVEPLAVAVRAARQAGDLSGKTVLIAGAGPIGLLTLIAAKQHGAKAVAVTVRTASRRELAMKLGATVAVDPTREGWLQEIGRAMDTTEFDVAFDAAGIQPTFDQCLENVARGGAVVAIGTWGEVNLDLKLLAPRELKVVGTVTYVPKDFGDACDWLGDGRVPAELLVTEQRPMSEGLAVLEEMEKNPSRTIKAVLVAGA